MQNDSANNPETVFLVYITCPDATTATRIAEVLVTDCIAACVNIVPGIQSTYHWQGVVETATESLLMIKTRRGRLDGVRSCVDKWHPDELPELIAIEITEGSKRYLDWIVDETR